MTTLLLCDYPLESTSVRRDMGIPDGCLLDRHGAEPPLLRGRTPYLLGRENPAEDEIVCGMLDRHGALLTELCLSFGGPTTLALARLTQDIEYFGPDLMLGLGSATTIAGTRLGGFASALEAHQRNILAYRAATRGGAPGGLSKGAARMALQESGRVLNQRFATEVDVLGSSLSPRYRTLISNGQRVPDLVRQTSRVARLDVASRAQATTLLCLARNVKRFGRGLFIVELASRFNAVRGEAERDGDWRRRAFEEAGGMALAYLAGRLLGRASAGAVGLVGVGTRSPAVILATAAAAVPLVAEGTRAADEVGQRLGAGVYERLFQSPGASR